MEEWICEKAISLPEAKPVFSFFLLFFSRCHWNKNHFRLPTVFSLKIRDGGRIAQWLERRNSNSKYQGSIPWWS